VQAAGFGCLLFVFFPEWALWGTTALFDMAVFVQLIECALLWENCRGFLDLFIFSLYNSNNYALSEETY
jgi:hypothetical protein